MDAVENKIDTVVSYLKDVVYSDGATDVKYFTIAINRKINDVEMYGDLTVEHDNFNLTRTKDVLIENLSDLILYEVEERISEFDLGCEVTISITPDIDEGLTYSFIFQSEICHVKPFQDSDIIKVFTQYYYAEALEARATVRFELNDDIFNERFGFRTEDPTGEFDDVDGPFYSIAYIDKVTNIILDTSKNSNLEIHSIPKDPMIIFVRLSFVSYGKQYTFFSNEAVIQEKMPNALLDGYKNRTVIGLNDGGQHFLEFQTKFALDDVATFAIGPYYYEGDEIVYLGLHVYDPTYDPDAELNKNDNGENDEENNKKGEDDDDDEKPDVEIEYFATLSNEFFRFNLNFDKVGEYTIYCNFAYETNDSVENYSSRNYWNQTIKVEEGVVAKTLDPEEAFSLDVKVGNNKSNALVNENSSSIICTAGGSPIELSTSIPEELIAQGEKIKFNVDLDNVGNCIAVNVSDDGNKIIINPTSEGSTSLTLCAEITGLGIVEKVINFKVYGDISNYSEILVNDEFHYSNTDLEVKLNLKTEEKICNVKIQWEVLDSDGSPAEFTVSDDMMSIILVNPKQDDYTITALQNGFKLCSQSVQIRDFNIDKFVQNNIWWMFIIALALLAGVVAIKIFLTRNNTIIDQISGACQLVEKIDLSSKNVNRDFFKLKLMLQKKFVIREI